MSKLPRVTSETARAVSEAVMDDPETFLFGTLKRLDEENPHIAAEIREWVKRSGLHPVNALIGVVTVYQLLAAQAEADAVKF